MCGLGCQGRRPARGVRRWSLACNDRNHSHSHQKDRQIRLITRVQDGDVDILFVLFFLAPGVCLFFSFFLGGLVATYPSVMVPELAWVSSLLVLYAQMGICIIARAFFTWSLRWAFGFRGFGNGFIWPGLRSCYLHHWPDIAIVGGSCHSFVGFPCVETRGLEPRVQSSAYLAYSGFHFLFLSFCHHHQQQSFF